MDTKLFARIGAGAFVAIALTMTALQLREGPLRPVPEIEYVTDDEGDPLDVMLRDCAAMGEQALEIPSCLAAWAEKRRRFLGARPRPVDPVAEDGAPSAAPVDPQPVTGG